MQEETVAEITRPDVLEKQHYLFQQHCCQRRETGLDPVLLEM